MALSDLGETSLPGKKGDDHRHLLLITALGVSGKMPTYYILIYNLYNAISSVGIMYKYTESKYDDTHAQCVAMMI